MSFKDMGKLQCIRIMDHYSAIKTNYRYTQYLGYILREICWVKTINFKYFILEWFIWTGNVGRTLLNIHKIWSSMSSTARKNKNVQFLIFDINLL